MKDRQLPRISGRTVMAALVAAAMIAGFAPTPALAAPGLVVSDLNHSVTPTDLANTLVGSGVTISNVTFTGNNRAAGKFSGGATILGFDTGIVLGSGKVQTVAGDAACSHGVEGPNNCHEATGIVPVGSSGTDNTTSFGTAGDPALDTLAGFTTFDAAILEFDFVPVGGTVQFQYVFSSDEYSDYSNTQFNDVFGFFVNGTNCATVGLMNQPVSINTINNGNDAGGDPTPHNAVLFRDNVRPAGPTINTEMDGLTVVLTCKATVKAGMTNHMKLAIADGSDRILDSAVFLQGGSLISGTQVTTSLRGGGQTGPVITVPSGTAVTDSATLAGLNTSTAGGTVTYTVYSDANCTVVFASAGTKTVTNGIVPDSDPVTFVSPATYYWQAAYSGDTLNNPSKSLCGSEQVIVKVGPPATLVLTPPTATNAVGDPHTVTATVRDATGTPVPGITVRFTVIGAAATFASPTSGSGVTNSSGQTTFTFTAALPGTNGIHAFADFNPNNGSQDPGEPFGDATKVWTPPVGTALCEIKITDGGHITAINGDQGSFGGVARSDAAGNASGNEEYQDHGPAQPMNVKAITILAITCTADFKTATVFGNATIDGSGSFPFRIRMTDNGEPGTADVYGIILSNGYVSGDKVLEGGNIQIHKAP